LLGEGCAEAQQEEDECDLSKELSHCRGSFQENGGVRDTLILLHNL
jgi:hypothetical protein